MTSCNQVISRRENLEAERLMDIAKSSLEKAERNESKVNQEILALDGMTGKKTRHFYNNLLSHPNIRYLEVGTYKGSSTCAAMFGNEAEVICIDNWSEFGGPKKEFLNNFQKFKGKNRAMFIEKNCFTIEPHEIPFSCNIYLYDGPHQCDDHYRALKQFLPSLENEFIYVVDDWNWAQVREGTKKSIQDLGLKVLYEKEIRLTQDNSVTKRPELTDTWWNGIYVAVLQK